jgi:predicted outer membrane repeat protein
MKFTTRRRKATKNRFTLRIETLEARRLLTSYVVDTLIDNPAAVAAEVDGAVSLREAISAANSNAIFGDAPAGQSGGTVDAIAFDTSLSGQTIVLGGQELTVSDHLSISGLGQSDLAISGNDASPILIVDFGVTADVSGVTITGGSAYDGGGIYNEGTLNVANSALINNSASDQGGAVFNDGTFNLVNGTFSGNTSGTQGGAIKNGADGKLTIADSTFSENTAGSSGGAIDSFHGFGAATGSLDITNTTFESNSGSNGGAIYNWLPAHIEGSRFVGNSARGTGGAFANRFANSSYLTTINASTFENNEAGLYGGAIDNTGASMEITNSTLSGNTAGREGGAIENYFAGLKVINSTISGNSTNRTGGGIWNLGTLQITSSTLVANRANANGDTRGDGGGIFDDGSSSAPVIHNTIIGGNLVGAPLADAASDVVGALDGSSSHNLIGNAATSGGLADTVNGNIVGNGGIGTLDITAVLDPTLADNGGPTLTHALLPSGLAVNAGENTLAVDASGNPLEHDQRGDGFSRIVDATVDIGAFELPPQP